MVTKPSSLSMLALSLIMLSQNTYADTANAVLEKYGYPTIELSGSLDDEIQDLEQQYQTAYKDNENAKDYNTIRDAAIAVQENKINDLDKQLEVIYRDIDNTKDELLKVLLLEEADELIARDREYKNTIDKANDVLAKKDEFTMVDGMVQTEADLLAQQERIQALKEQASTMVDGADIGTVADMKPPFVGKGYLTSPFGTRIDPITGQPGAFHDAQDYGIPEGTPIVASLGGVVVDAGFNGGFGNYVAIDHGLGVATYYAHLSELVSREGDIVKQGELIAYSGNTGRSTGPHLHWGVRINGEPVDPAILLKN